MDGDGLSLVLIGGAWADTVHEVARSFSNAGTSDSSKEGPQLNPHSPIHLALPLAWDCNENGLTHGTIT